MMRFKIDYENSKIKATILFALTSFILISPALFSFGPALAQVSKAPTSNSRPIGIDVSGNDNKINWTKVEASSIGGKPIQFAIIKASQFKIDPQFQINWQGTSKTRILHGAYHFFTWPADPVKQAKLFVSTLNSQNPVAYAAGSFPPSVDVEPASWSMKSLSTHQKELVPDNLTKVLN